MQGNGGRYSTDSSAYDGDIFLQKSYRLITIIDVFDQIWVAVGLSAIRISLPKQIFELHPRIRLAVAILYDHRSV